MHEIAFNAHLWLPGFKYTLSASIGPKFFSCIKPEDQPTSKSIMDKTNVREKVSGSELSGDEMFERSRASGNLLKFLRKYVILFWLGFIIVVLAMAATRDVYSNGSRHAGALEPFIIFLAKLPHHILKMSKGTKPLVIESVKEQHGFTYSDKYSGSKDYVLISVWDDTLDQSIVKLVRINDGKILHKWVPDIDNLNKIYNAAEKEIKTSEVVKSSTQLLHPYLLPDGSLIVSAGGIFRIDKDSNIIWANPSTSHHSIEPDQEGNVWFCGLNSSPVNMDKYEIRDESIKKISISDGKVLFEKSVFDLLMENGYGRANFFNSPFLDTLSRKLDYIHLNDVQPVLEDSKYWKKGDVFLSLRHQNLVLLYRPSTNKMLWHQKGPWLKQHDVDIIDSTSISIFGNNVIDAKLRTPQRLIDGHNTQYVYNFSNGELKKPYEEFFKSSAIGTVTQGLSTILSDGTLFVEETKKGRLLFGDKESVLWSYTERIDDKRISLLGWCRYVTEEEFKKFTFIK